MISISVLPQVGQEMMFTPRWRILRDFSISIGHADFLDRISGQRNPHRVADAFGKQDAEADARFDRAR